MNLEIVVLFLFVAIAVFGFTCWVIQEFRNAEQDRLRSYEVREEYDRLKLMKEQGWFNKPKNSYSNVIEGNFRKLK